jgi:DNA-binding IclR family transcriptional regulator/site-specific recombinase XerD
VVSRAVNPGAADGTKNRSIDLENGHPGASSSVIEKAILIVETLGAAEHPLGPSDLSRRSGLAKTTVHRLLNLLLTHHYVQHHGTGYTLSPRIPQSEDSAQARYRAELRRIAMPYLLDMHRVTGHAVLLAALEGEQVSYLEALYGHAWAAAPSARRRRAPAHATAAGKLLLAYQPSPLTERLDSSLPAYTPRTRTTLGDLSRELAGIRHRGIAYNYQEYTPGLDCVAVPIPRQSGPPLAALAISGPAGRFTPHISAPHLQRAAQALSRATYNLPADTTVPAHRTPTTVQASPTATSDTAATRQTPQTTSDTGAHRDTEGPAEARRRPGGRPTPAPPGLTEAFTTYQTALSTRGDTLGEDTVRAYLSRVRQFLDWLAHAEVNGAPLAEPNARDEAVRDYRTWLLTVARRKASTVNAHLSAIDDFYRRRGLGPANASRQKLPKTTPHTLDARARTRWLRAVERAAPRDKALAYIEFYAGVRGSETVALDLGDVWISARKNHLVVRYAKNGRRREVALHPKLRTALQTWWTERATWPGASENPALFLNHRGGRLSTRGAYNILNNIAADATPALGPGDHHQPVATPIDNPDQRVRGTVHPDPRGG